MWKGKGGERGRERDGSRETCTYCIGERSIRDTM